MQNSVYDVNPKNEIVINRIQKMRVIIVKGIGYVVINPRTSAELVKRMGDVAAEYVEETFRNELAKEN
jgi:hypothetical protein